MKHLVIGLAGGTGSGKTTLANRIYEAFPNDSVLIGMDCYYKNNVDLPFEERVKTNYDSPDAFDIEMFIDHIKALKRDEEVLVPQYDYTKHLRAPEVVKAEPRRIIILEGILLFADPRLVDLLDIKIFVDTDADVRILRRMLRDVKERGRSMDSVVTQYLTTVKPMHEKFVEPCKKVADIIVPEGGHNDIAFDMITSTIINRLKE